MLFKVPGVQDATLAIGDQVIQIRGGIVDCPPDVGHGSHWHQLTPAEAAAYEEAATAPAPKRSRAKAADAEPKSDAE